MSEELIDPHDREYISTISDPRQRDVVTESLARYRAPESLRVGERVPAAGVVRLDPYGPVRLDRLVDGRPVVLVFGSYT